MEQLEDKSYQRAVYLRSCSTNFILPIRVSLPVVACLFISAHRLFQPLHCFGIVRDRALPNHLNGVQFSVRRILKLLQ